MFTTKTALSLHGTFKSTTIFNNLRSPNLPQIYKLLLSKEHGESLQRKKGSSFLPEQNIADKLTKLPCRLSLVEFGILLDNSCIRTSGTTKLSKRQFSDSASSVEASPGRTVGDLLKVKGENFYSTKV